MNYQKIIKIGMAKHGIKTLKELAYRAGVSVSSLSDLVNGATQNPSVNFLIKLASAMNIGLATMLKYGEDDE